MKEKIVETLMGITLRSGNEYSVQELLSGEEDEVMIFQNAHGMECRVQQSAIAMKVYDIQTIQVPKNMFDT